jgi:enoyl-CoA hydratase
MTPVTPLTPLTPMPQDDAMPFSFITYSVADHVAQLTLNRPERLNALHAGALKEINTAMDRAEADADVRVVVVSGAGRAFSSGFDLKAQMEQAPAGDAVWRGILDLDFDTTMRFWNSPKPTIAAVHGACLAGAFELAMACDITIADEDATFGEPELKFGAGIVTLLLPWMTSPKQAKRIILSADDRIPAREALAMGLVSRVVAAGTHLAEALRTARGIALMDPNLVVQTKKALNRTYDIQGMPTALRMALDIDHSIESHGSPDKRAFMDVARERGMREAIAWRDARFAKAQGDG